MGTQNEIAEVHGVNSVPDLEIIGCPKEETGGMNHHNIVEDPLAITKTLMYHLHCLYYCLYT